VQQLVPGDTWALYKTLSLLGQLDRVAEVSKESKPCPACGAAVCKRGTSNRVTCDACQYYCCFLCLTHLTRRGHYTSGGACAGRAFTLADGSVDPTAEEESDSELDSSDDEQHTEETHQSHVDQPLTATQARALQREDRERTRFRRRFERSVRREARRDKVRSAAKKTGRVGAKVGIVSLVVVTAPISIPVGVGIYAYGMHHSMKYL
jgi:hypothetical protein